MTQSTGRTQGISQKVAIGDPGSPDHVIKPNADGSVNIASTGGGGALATEATLLNVLTQDTLTNTLLATPATALPPPVPVGAGDTTFSRGTITLTAQNGDAIIVAAVSAQSTRIHGLFITLSAAVAETLVTVKRGSTAIGYFAVPATPAELVIDRRDLVQWLYKTGNNEAFILSPAAAVNIRGDYLYVTGA